MARKVVQHDAQAMLLHGMQSMPDMCIESRSLEAPTHDSINPFLASKMPSIMT